MAGLSRAARREMRRTAGRSNRGSLRASPPSSQRSVSVLRSALGYPLANDLEVVGLRAVPSTATKGHLRKHLARRRIVLRAIEGAVLRGAWLDQHAPPALGDFVRCQRRVELRVVVWKQVR